MREDIKNRIDKTLVELWLGILFFTVFCQFSIVWFVNSALKFSLGLWIGALLALISAYHMWWALQKNFSKYGNDEKKVQSIAIRNNVIRYGLIAIVFLFVCLTDFMYPLAVFLGIMGLKVGAYLQPLTHKCLKKWIQQ